MYRALFSLAYYGLMRIGELTTGTHPVLTKDVYVGIEKDKILLILRTSKTHGLKSLPQKIIIESIQFQRHDAMFCPFTIVHRFMRIRGGYQDDAEPFFTFQDKSPVSPNHVCERLKQLLVAVNLDPTLYRMHSMRAGCALDMYKLGFSILQIQKAGRWKSGAVYHYLKS